MRPADLIRSAAAALGNNKLRSGLTMLGITIGVFSVVGVMTALSAIGTSIDSGLSVLGTHVFQIQRNPAVQIGGPQRSRGRPVITITEARRFASLMPAEVHTINFEVQHWGVLVRHQDRETAPRMAVVGTDAHYLNTHNFRLDYGRNLLADDVELGRPVAVIGYDIQQELFPFENPIGAWITIGGARYRVVGVLEEKGSLFGGQQDNRILVPITRFMGDFSNHWQSVNIAVQAPDAESFEEIRETAIGAMRLARRLDPGAENNFEVFSNDSLRDAFARIAAAVGAGGFLISAIALVAAGIGIMNIMLVSVTERTREIGIRKSIGARRKDILRQFLLESVYLSQLGGLAGIALGVLVGNFVAAQMNVPMLFPWFWAVVAVVTCTIIGVTFGLYPAWKAARLDPVDSLRFE
ncbi:MAG: FtsX-like permease family protein [Puniceicoccaceae bacterium]|nr:MAG: FtsX-like permease family protein [Puniceicoccaceae bacterium]